MTAETLSAAAGLLLALAAAYLPRFAGRFARLDGVRKRLVMLAMLATAAALSWAWRCNIPAWSAATPWSALPACDRGAAVTLLQAFLAALAANQSAYLVAVRRKPTDLEFGEAIAAAILSGRGGGAAQPVADGSPRSGLLGRTRYNGENLFWYSIQLNLRE